MRLIGIMRERWCSSSRASCSVATPGGRSRSSCRNAIRAGCSTTPSIRSRAVCARSLASGRLRARRLFARRTTRTARGASVTVVLHPPSCSLVPTAGIEEGPMRVQRAEADEKLASWIEAMPIEDIVALWERQPLFADQSERAGRGAAARAACRTIRARSRCCSAPRARASLDAGLARAALARGPAARDRGRPRRRLQPPRRSGSRPWRRTRAPRSSRRRATRLTCSSPSEVARADHATYWMQSRSDR